MPGAPRVSSTVRRSSGKNRGGSDGGGAVDGTTMTSYNDIATNVFERNVSELERILRDTARDGDASKLVALLDKRTEVEFDVDSRDLMVGNTALILASQAGHYKAVQLLTKYAADVTASNREGQTAVQLASTTGVRQLLLGSVDKGGPQRNLCQAAWQGDAMLLRKIILSDSGIDVNCHNADGLTPLMLASRDVEYFESLSGIDYAYRPLGVICELLAQSGDVNAIDVNKRTALHYVCTCRSNVATKIVERLLEAGADSNGRDISWRTPLHNAANSGNVDVVSQLLDSGADPSSRDSSGFTPLHLSALGGHEQVVSVLLRRGADGTIASETGQTAVDVAQTKRIQTMLRQYLPAASSAATATGPETLNVLKTQSITRISSASDVTASAAAAAVSSGGGDGSRIGSSSVSHGGGRRMERSKSEEQEDTTDGIIQRQVSARLTGTQTPPATASNYNEEGSPRQLSMSGAIYSRHMLSSNPQLGETSSFGRSASLRLASTSQSRLNQKGMASMPTRRSPVLQHRLPFKAIGPTTSTASTAVETSAAGGEDGKVTTNPSETPVTSTDMTRTFNTSGNISDSTTNSKTSQVKLNFGELMNFGDVNKVVCQSVSRTTQQQAEPTLPLNTTGVSGLVPPMPVLTSSFKSILRVGEFKIEDSRIRQSDDSGVGTEDCGTDSTSSSSSNLSTSGDCSNPAGKSENSKAAVKEPSGAEPIAATSTAATKVVQNLSRSNNNDCAVPVSKVDVETAVVCTARTPTVATSTCSNQTTGQTAKCISVAPVKAISTVKSCPNAVSIISKPPLTTGVVTVIKSRLNQDAVCPLSTCADAKPTFVSTTTGSQVVDVSKSAEFVVRDQQQQPSDLDGKVLEDVGKPVRKVESSPVITLPTTDVETKAKTASSSGDVVPQQANCLGRVVVPKLKQLDVNVQQSKPSSRQAPDAYHKKIASCSVKETPPQSGRNTDRSKLAIDNAVLGQSVSVSRLKVHKISDENDETASANVAADQIPPVKTPPDGASSKQQSADHRLRKTRDRPNVSVGGLTTRKLLPIAPRPSPPAEEGSQNPLPVGSRPAANDSSPAPAQEASSQEDPMRPVTSTSLHSQRVTAAVAAGPQRPKDWGRSRQGSTITNQPTTPSVTAKAAGSPRSLDVGRSSAEHDGPVICDVFESLRRRQQEEAIAAARSGESRGPVLPFSVPVTPCFGKSPPSGRPKTGMSVGACSVQSSRGVRHPAVKARPVQSRPSSGRRKKLRAPAVPTTSTSGPASGVQQTTSSRGGKTRSSPRKDGKRARKKELAPSKSQDFDDDADEINVDAPDVTLIGGIGWQIVTPCEDMTGVHAVPEFAQVQKTVKKTKQPLPSSRRKKIKAQSESARVPNNVEAAISTFSDSDDEVFTITDSERVGKKDAVLPNVLDAAAYVDEKTEPAAAAAAALPAPDLFSHKQKPTSHQETRTSFEAAVTTLSNDGFANVVERTNDLPSTATKKSRRLSSMGASESDSFGQRHRSTSSMKLDDEEDDQSWSKSTDDSLSNSSQRLQQNKTRPNVDAEIDAAIDEIMGSVSMNSLRKTSSRRGSKVRNEPVRTSLETERLTDDKQMTSDVADNSQRPLPGDVMQDRQNSGDEVGMARWIKAYQTMPLRVTASKPPISARQLSNISTTTPPETADSGADPVDPLEDQQIPRLDRSPRFVRKHDSITTSASRPSSRRRKHAGGGGGHRDSLASSIDLETSLNLYDNEDSMSAIVTSRLGRSSRSLSRVGSAASETFSATSDDVETIQWKRGNVLGKGAFGTVWCGLTNAGELIAVKMIELNTADMDKAEREYEQIQEEVGILKTLKHKNIVGYLGTCLEDMVVSIFMQFVPGGSIANLLARFGALEEEVFCNYTRQILEGVEFLHHNNVIHRDIKGGNIMLMPDGVIKLIDFGCAKKLCLNLITGSPNELLRSMRGTPYWMAPEVVKEEGHGTKSDLWSIGCTVFEMATKKPPWSDMSPSAAIYSIGSDSKPIPQLPDKFSHQARHFVNLCLTRDPDRRPSATQLLTHAFVTPRRRTAKTSRRN